MKKLCSHEEKLGGCVLWEHVLAWKKKITA